MYKLLGFPLRRSLIPLTRTYRPNRINRTRSMSVSIKATNEVKATIDESAYKWSELESEEEYNAHIAKILAQNKQHLQSLNYPGCRPNFKAEPNTVDPHPKDIKVFFFDIDNCLYKRSTKIHDLMQIYIHNYFVKKLKLDDEKAFELHHMYYKNYGLAIQGLVKHHQIDALEYNEKVDDALPLQDILKPDPKLREMLLKLKNSGKVDKLWLFTNAYKNHGIRCVSLLGIADLFDGLTFCDYGLQQDFVCKPSKQAFELAKSHAGVTDLSKCYFVDDSLSNIETSVALNLKKSIHFVENDADLGKTPKEALVIRDILELETALPELFTK